MIVGPQDEAQILDRDDEDEGPEDERQHPQYVVLVGRQAVGGVK
jgi:hypothetical protein